MSTDRSRVLAILRDIRDTILADRAAGSSRRADPRVDEAVRRACARHGVPVESWQAALDADPELARLVEQTLEEIIVDSPDPGPYDAISRESPRGGPEPASDARERDERMLGGAPAASGPRR